MIIESRAQALGTLANATGIIVGTKLALTKDFRMLKTKVTAIVRASTDGEGAGLALYLVAGQYTLAQFEAALEANGPLDPNDSVGEELAMRFFEWISSAEKGGGVEKPFIGQDGGAQAIVKPGWTFKETKSWNWIVYNHGVALTTGSTVVVKAKSFGVWIR